MNRLLLSGATLLAMAMLFTSTPAQASQPIWELTSPDHGQTYAYGSEQSRVWKALGRSNHLALFATYSNDPFAEGAYRRYDYFTFNFPEVKLGADGETFYYHAPDGPVLPVAEKRRDFFGVYTIKLLPTSYLIVRKVHGYLNLTLVIGDSPLEPNPGIEIGIEH